MMFRGQHTKKQLLHTWMLSVEACFPGIHSGSEFPDMDAFFGEIFDSRISPRQVKSQLQTRPTTNALETNLASA
jgi:hypothetical protein